MRGAARAPYEAARRDVMQLFADLHGHHAVEHGPFVVALYDVESRLGGTVHQGPGLRVLRYENDKIVEASWYRAGQFPR